MTGRCPGRFLGNERPGRPGPVPVLATVTCCATLLACDAGDGGSEITRRDSAGMEIVESAVAIDSPSDLGELRLEIGRIHGPEAYQLHDVESALRLSDGRIVVVNRGTNELRFYDTAGVHLGSTPGRGDGPGEFTDLKAAVRIPGDSLVAFSTFGYRISLFDPEGRYVQELRPWISGAEVLAVRGGLPGGWLVVSGTLGDYSSSALETGLHRPTERWATVARDGTVRDTLGHFPWVRGGLYQYHGDGWGMQMIVDFAAATSYDVTNGRVFVGGGQRAEVRTLTSDGSVERILRWDAYPGPLTADFVAAHRERLLKGVEDPDRRRRYEAAIGAFSYPDSLPVFEALEATPAGGLWIQAFSPEHATGPERWWVFDSSGRSLGTVDVPAGFRITDVGRDVVLGIHTDDLGVQRVRVYDRPPFPQ